jgi:outer membrane autotransporter protein
MLTARISLRSSITLLLSLACVGLAVMWPGWLTSFRAEGSYELQDASAAGNVSLSVASLQNMNISLRLGALRGGSVGGDRRAASADARDGRFGGLDVFVNGLGSFGDQDTTNREIGFDFHTAGLTFGADYRLTDSLVVGAALGYLRTKTELNNQVGEVTTDGYTVSAFAGYSLGSAFFVDGIVTYGWNSYETERSVPGVGTARGAPDGHQFALSVGAGYNFNVGALTLGPIAKVNYLHVHIDRYREHGTGGGDLRVDSQSIESVTTDLGAQVSYAIGVPWGVLSPMAKLEWEHEYQNDSRRVTGRSVAAPGTTFSLQTNNPDRDYFNFGTGLTSTFSRGITGFFFYETVLGREHFSNHSFTAGIRFELN